MSKLLGGRLSCDLCCMSKLLGGRLSCDLCCMSKLQWRPHRNVDSSRVDSAIKTVSSLTLSTAV